MLSKCANPACPTPFLYLHQGKIFNLEVEAGPAGGTLGNALGRGRKLEHYWLCDNCARSLTVVYEHGRVVTRLARPALVDGQAHPASAAHAA